MGNFVNVQRITFTPAQTSTENVLFTSFENLKCRRILAYKMKCAITRRCSKEIVQVNLSDSQHVLMFFQLDCSAFIGVCLCNHVEMNNFCLLITLTLGISHHWNATLKCLPSVTTWLQLIRVNCTVHDSDNYLHNWARQLNVRKKAT